MKRRTLRRSLKIRTRILLRRLDRETPEWMRWVTPWGWSLVLHAVAVSALGLLFYVNTTPPAVNGLDSSFVPAGQLTEDLTSIAPADTSGDPFTTIQTPEPPSFPSTRRGRTRPPPPSPPCPSGRATD